MATKVTRLMSGSSGYLADDAQTIYLLKAGRSLSFAGADTIDATAQRSGREFVINGALSVSGGYDALQVGLAATPSPATLVTIGGTGTINGTGNGVVIWGNNSTIINHGVISVTGAYSGVAMSGKTNRLDNDGRIAGQYAVVAWDDGTVIANDGVIDGSINGIHLLTFAGDSMRLVNTGRIVGDSHSFMGSSGNETVINRGRMVGDVVLGAGRDTFDGREGVATAKVFGGEGNDHFVMGTSFYDIWELKDGGFDTLKTAYGLYMVGSVEKITLTGNRNINIRMANNEDHWLYGNSANNIMGGGGGKDVIRGHGGNDEVTGGLGADTFIFSNGDGRDVITDFIHGTDTLDLRGWSGITSFADLKNNHSSFAGGSMIITVGSDRITLEDMAPNELKAGDVLI